MTSRLDDETLERIRSDLEHDDPTTRAQAVDALATLGDARGLLRALGSEDGYVRCVALRGLATEPGEHTTWRIAQGVWDADEHVRVAVARALGCRSGWLPVHALRRLAESDQAPSVRATALTAYATAAFPNADELLRAAATADDDAEVRCEAARLIARRAATERP